MVSSQEVRLLRWVSLRLLNEPVCCPYRYALCNNVIYPLNILSPFCHLPQLFCSFEQPNFKKHFFNILNLESQPVANILWLQIRDCMNNPFLHLECSRGQVQLVGTHQSCDTLTTCTCTYSNNTILECTYINTNTPNWIEYTHSISICTHGTTNIRSNCSRNPFWRLLVASWDGALVASLFGHEGVTACRRRCDDASGSHKKGGFGLGPSCLRTMEGAERVRSNRCTSWWKGEASESPFRFPVWCDAAT